LKKGMERMVLDSVERRSECVLLGYEEVLDKANASVREKTNLEAPGRSSGCATFLVVLHLIGTSLARFDLGGGGYIPSTTRESVPSVRLAFRPTLSVESMANGC
jgi:hypothetical protein